MPAYFSVVQLYLSFHKQEKINHNWSYCSWAAAESQWVPQTPWMLWTERLGADFCPHTQTLLTSTSEGQILHLLPLPVPQLCSRENKPIAVRNLSRGQDYSCRSKFAGVFDWVLALIRCEVHRRNNEAPAGYHFCWEMARHVNMFMLRDHTCSRLKCIIYSIMYSIIYS